MCLCSRTPTHCRPHAQSSALPIFRLPRRCRIHKPRSLSPMTKHMLPKCIMRHARYMALSAMHLWWLILPTSLFLCKRNKVADITLLYVAMRAAPADCMRPMHPLLCSPTKTWRLQACASTTTLVGFPCLTRTLSTWIRLHAHGESSWHRPTRKSTYPRINILMWRFKTLSGWVYRQAHF